MVCPGESQLKPAACEHAADQRGSRVLIRSSESAKPAADPAVGVLPLILNDWGFASMFIR